MAESRHDNLSGATRSAQATRQGAEAAARGAQAGATALRGAGGAAATLAQSGGQATSHVARQGAREVAEDGRHATDAAAHDIEQTAERYAEALRHVAHDLGRLMMVPRSAGGGLQDMQEAMGAMMTGVLRTNIRITSELFRRTNFGSLAELQGTFLREYLDALMEGGTTVLRATRRTAEEALRPLEHRATGDGEDRQPRVGEVMSHDVRVVSPEETVQQAAKLMTEADAGALPVGEGDRLVGMVTDRDLALRVLAEAKDPSRTKVREVMSPGTRYVFEDAPLEEAAETMEHEQLRRLPVLNRDKRLVGIVSLGDLARRRAPRAGRAMAGIAREGGRHDQAAG
ncbi:CBS domain-containing protein [Falsiroseomonas sp. HW251]|uniref:CBS domain-containing protein n=1 Tax=Falsiroseomonas sp. HW251 TaxID=3390998 RepID=UPI003D316D2E